MAKTTSATLEQMLAGIEERINMLHTLKDAMTFAFTGEYHGQDLPEEAPARAPRRAKRHSRRVARVAVRGTNRELFTAILRDAGTPLSTDEVYSKAMSRHWQTTSGDPRNLVAVTLRTMSHQGHVRKVGSDWEYMPQEILETGTGAGATV